MSLASQALVIFVIRTSLRPWQSHPHPALIASSLGVVLLAVALPFSILAPWFGFVPLLPGVLLALLRSLPSTCSRSSTQKSGSWLDVPLPAELEWH